MPDKKPAKRRKPVKRQKPVFTAPMLGGGHTGKFAPLAKMALDNPSLLALALRAAR
jgi:hypothetical protein